MEKNPPQTAMARRHDEHKDSKTMRPLEEAHFSEKGVQMQSDFLSEVNKAKKQ